MSINDTLLVECVRAHPEIYDKGHAGFKNAGIKDSAWKIVAETLNASVKDCTARWQTLRERFTKEKRILEQEARSGAAASTRPEWPLYNILKFLTPHIRKRKSVDNFPPKASVSVPTLSLTDEESSLLPSLASPGVEIILDEQIVDDPFKVNDTCSPLSSPSPMCTSSAAAANMPYLGPTGRCKKPKKDETAEMFKETLANLNKSMATYSAPAPPPPPSIDTNNPDVLIGKNVESCLKNLTNMALKLKYRRKFRSLIQDCEEEAEGLNESV
ncbi:PREDICTED: uncharacterized protein LOC105562250 [Vollenhovia emeryi]|uniref:uncharacterized protein LOC105562250 n=1 Tax=Vollenhovia emeryi TaxID=411798 RepID=UPI0005F49328|nr:PREDICTED: uncharacterized protein LOC105562250 [Vollenhovia emeryi]